MNQFLFKTNVQDLKGVPSEESTETKRPVIRATRPRLVKPLSMQSRRAERLDKQLRMISLYAASDWRKLAK
jgi:hypothetical protein